VIQFETLKQFGQAVHLSPETLRDRIKEGRLEAVRKGATGKLVGSYRAEFREKQ
jgi:hypothetical protein